MSDKQKYEDSNQDVIEVIEILLQRAKRGEIRNFYAVILFDKQVGSVYTLRNKSCLNNSAIANVLLNELLARQHAEIIEILDSGSEQHVH